MPRRSITIHKKEFLLFTKHDHSDLIACQVRLHLGPPLGVQVVQEDVDEHAVQALAEKRGKTTWDEDDLCTLLEAERVPRPTPLPTPDIHTGKQDITSTITVSPT